MEKSQKSAYISHFIQFTYPCLDTENIITVEHFRMGEQQRAVSTLMPTAAKHCHLLVAAKQITVLSKNVSYEYYLIIYFNM